MNLEQTDITTKEQILNNLQNHQNVSSLAH